MTEIQLTTPHGIMPAYTASADNPRGAIIVVQEAFGITPHIQSICDRLADAGWLAIAPALFHREGSPVFSYEDMDGAMGIIKTLTAENIAQDINATFGYLRDAGYENKQCGIIGFCMGGTVSFVMGATKPLGAAVTFYGGGVSEGRFGYPSLGELAAQLQTPWIGFYGDLDQGIPSDQVELLRTKVKEAKVDTEIVRYPEAGHGFNCNDRSAFHAPSAADAWARTLEWFDRHIVQ